METKSYSLKMLQKRREISLYSKKEENNDRDTIDDMNSDQVEGKYCVSRLDRGETISNEGVK